MVGPGGRRDERAHPRARVDGDGAAHHRGALPRMARPEVGARRSRSARRERPDGAAAGRRQLRARIADPCDQPEGDPLLRCAVHVRPARDRELDVDSSDRSSCRGAEPRHIRRPCAAVLGCAHRGRLRTAPPTLRGGVRLRLRIRRDRFLLSSLRPTRRPSNARLAECARSPRCIRRSCVAMSGCSRRALPHPCRSARRMRQSRVRAPTEGTCGHGGLIPEPAASG